MEKRKFKMNWKLFGEGMLTAIRDVVRKLNLGANILIAGMGFMVFALVLLNYGLYSFFAYRLIFWLLVMGKLSVYIELRDYKGYNTRNELINKIVSVILLVMAFIIAA